MIMMVGETNHLFFCCDSSIVNTKILQYCIYCSVPVTHCNPLSPINKELVCRNVKLPFETCKPNSNFKLHAHFDEPEFINLTTSLGSETIKLAL